MEILLTILAVTLLIILPVLFLVLVVGGLIYTLYRAIVGTKEKGVAPSAPGPDDGPTGTTDLPAEDPVAHNVKR